MGHQFLSHNYLCRAQEMKKFELENVKLSGKHLVLIDQTVEGYITSPEIDTLEFSELVASWSAITPNTATIELLVSVCVDGVFSKFFSYGQWRLGKENYYYNQDDTLAKMSVDEVIIKDGKKAKSFKFKMILKEDVLVSLICVTLKLENYSHQVDVNYLPSIVDYEIPKLNQNIVPEIGNQICSPTTAAMLLKFRGFDFARFDSEFEHRYIASLVADPGHNSPTYGNWVYNTAVIGAYGVDSYVARVYSWNELKYHLAKIGPVGASIRGDVGLYKTSGHLLLVRGYKEVDGKTFVLCNDPNINSRLGEGLFVYYEYPLELFMSVHRGIIYVIE